MKILVCGFSDENYEQARLNAMRWLVEQLRPHITVTEMPGDDFKVTVELNDLPGQ